MGAGHGLGDKCFGAFGALQITPSMDGSLLFVALLFVALMNHIKSWPGGGSRQPRSIGLD
jgi:hypothetical protein